MGLVFISLAVGEIKILLLEASENGEPYCEDVRCLKCPCPVPVAPCPVPVALYSLKICICHFWAGETAAVCVAENWRRDLFIAGFWCKYLDAVFLCRARVQHCPMETDVLYCDVITGGFWYFLSFMERIVVFSIYGVGLRSVKCIFCAKYNFMNYGALEIPLAPLSDCKSQTWDMKLACPSIVCTCLSPKHKV